MDPLPSPYCETVAGEICARVRRGERLTAVCRDPKMPNRATVQRWRARLPGFAAELARARAVGAALSATPTHRYSDELGDAVCARIAAGETVASIVADPAMPGATTLYFWLRRHPDFAARYDRASSIRDAAGLANLVVYTDETAEAFCARIATGEPMDKACSRPGMPDVSTVYRWLARRPEFAARYEAARELRRQTGGAYVTFSEAVTEELCERLIAGESLRGICADPTMPAYSTVMGWRENRPDFARRFETARRLALEMIDDHILHLVNTVTPETAPAARVQIAGLNSMANRLAKDPPERPPEQLTIRFVDPDGRKWEKD